MRTFSASILVVVLLRDWLRTCAAASVCVLATFSPTNSIEVARSATAEAVSSRTALRSTLDSRASKASRVPARSAFRTEAPSVVVVALLAAMALVATPGVTMASKPTTLAAPTAMPPRRKRFGCRFAAGEGSVVEEGCVGIFDGATRLIRAGGAIVPRVVPFRPSTFPCGGHARRTTHTKVAVLEGFSEILSGVAWGLLPAHHRGIGQAVLRGGVRRHRHPALRLANRARSGRWPRGVGPVTSERAGLDAWTCSTGVRRQSGSLRIPGGPPF